MFWVCRACTTRFWSRAQCRKNCAGVCNFASRECRSVKLGYRIWLAASSGRSQNSRGSSSGSRYGGRLATHGF